MEQAAFIKRSPYLYHLTDRRNLDFIFQEKKLFSAKALVELAGLPQAHAFLSGRRPEHTLLEVNGFPVHIRDQRPLNKALNKCLTHDWTPGQYIFHLNQRVFTWPNLHRLGIHFGRYAEESPVIFRLDTAAVLALNPQVEITNINSGATRPSGALDGKAAARGKDTFLPFDRYTRPVSSVAEVTFPVFCVLPNVLEVGNHPEGPWNLKKI
jgi:hypothetical protein